MIFATIDFETSGLDPKKDHIIEGAIVLWKSEKIGEDRYKIDELEFYEGYNDPKMEITKEITDLTGITQENVTGKSFDWLRFWTLVTKAEIVLAHNLIFDMGFIKKYNDTIPGQWGCTLNMIDWKKHGMPCRTLSHLAYELGTYEDPKNLHAAGPDARLTARLASTWLPDGTRVMDELMSVALKPWLNFKATGAPFNKKDVLKNAGFSWDPNEKNWFKIVPERDSPASAAFLAQVYERPFGWKVEPVKWV